MFVELVYDKRNVEGLTGAREIILNELTKRVHRIFPAAEVKVKPMQANSLNSDASKSDREKLNRMLEEIVAVIVLFRIGHIALSYQV
ncbi:DinI-like family protein [Pseudescherichia sp.]|uniref:DinI-like family protein n=1 Tax=Pseudescherichia sp. TaxID=2055881 RepID=UPI00289BD922|nr:DinI-like family protein [Pseudescherichia sp.]